MFESLVSTTLLLQAALTLTNMKVFDSLKTMNKYHDFYNSMTAIQQDEFSKAVFGLFEEKQISDDGVFPSFLITEKDLIEIGSKIKNS
jgi:hypothetical protein